MCDSISSCDTVNGVSWKFPCGMKTQNNKNKTLQAYMAPQIQQIFNEWVI